MSPRHSQSWMIDAPLPFHISLSCLLFAIRVKSLPASCSLFPIRSPFLLCALSESLFRLALSRRAFTRMWRFAPTGTYRQATHRRISPFLACAVDFFHSRRLRASNSASFFAVGSEQRAHSRMMRCRKRRSGIHTVNDNCWIYLR